MVSAVVELCKVLIEQRVRANRMEQVEATFERYLFLK